MDEKQEVNKMFGKIPEPELIAGCWPPPSRLPEGSLPQSEGVFAALKRDLDERDRIGWSTHNKPLVENDGRDWLKEAYAEALDLCVYLKAELMKRERR